MIQFRLYSLQLGILMAFALFGCEKISDSHPNTKFEETVVASPSTILATPAATAPSTPALPTPSPTAAIPSIAEATPLPALAGPILTIPLPLKSSSVITQAKSTLHSLPASTTQPSEQAQAATQAIAAFSDQLISTGEFNDRGQEVIRIYRDEKFASILNDIAKANDPQNMLFARQELDQMLDLLERNLADRSQGFVTEPQP